MAETGGLTDYFLARIEALNTAGDLWPPTRAALTADEVAAVLSRLLPGKWPSEVVRRALKSGTLIPGLHRVNGHWCVPLPLLAQAIANQCLPTLAGGVSKLGRIKVSADKLAQPVPRQKGHAGVIPSTVGFLTTHGEVGFHDEDGDTFFQEAVEPEDIVMPALSTEYAAKRHRVRMRRADKFAGAIFQQLALIEATERQVDGHAAGIGLPSKDPSKIHRS
jgi:hypothetical protein